jgi:hypothetical protein
MGFAMCAKEGLDEIDFPDPEEHKQKKEQLKELIMGCMDSNGCKKPEKPEDMDEDEDEDDEDGMGVPFIKITPEMKKGMKECGKQLVKEEVLPKLSECISKNSDFGGFNLQNMDPKLIKQALGLKLPGGGPEGPEDDDDDDEDGPPGPPGFFGGGKGRKGRKGRKGKGLHGKIRKLHHLVKKLQGDEDCDVEGFLQCVDDGSQDIFDPCMNPLQMFAKMAGKKVQVCKALKACEEEKPDESCLEDLKKVVQGCVKDLTGMSCDQGGRGGRGRGSFPPFPPFGGRGGRGKRQTRRRGRGRQGRGRNEGRRGGGRRRTSSDEEPSEFVKEMAQKLGTCMEKKGFEKPPIPGGGEGDEPPRMLVQMLARKAKHMFCRIKPRNPCEPPKDNEKRGGGRRGGEGGGRGRGRRGRGRSG